MRNLYFINLLLFCLNSFSQIKITDLEFENRRSNIEEIALTKTDNALLKANLLLEYSIKSKSTSKIAKAQSTLAYVKIILVETIEADSLNNKSLAQNILLNDIGEITKNYFNSALICSRKSDYVKAITLFLKSIDLAKKTKNYLLIQKSYRGLANSYCDQRNYDNALKYALKALDFSKFKSTTSEKSYLLATIAEIYRLKGDYENANKNFEKAYSNFVRIKEEAGQAYVLTNWSLCFDNDYEKLMEMELKAQEIWDRIAPENLMSVTNLGNLGYTYFDYAKSDSLQNSIKKIRLKRSTKEFLGLSEQCYKRCLLIAKKKRNLDSTLFYSEWLSVLQSYKGDYKNAFLNLTLRNKINDSLYSQKNKNKIAAIENEKEIQIRDKKIEISKINLANKEKQKYYFITGLILLSVIGSLLFYQSSNRKKVNEKLSFLNNELDESNKAKTRFFSILNHDLRGPVANLIFFLQLQKESPEMLDEESTKRMQDKTMAGAENLLNSMEDILQWSKSQMQNFKPQPLNVAVSTLFNDIKNHFSSEEKIKISFENIENIIINTDENYLKTILRNLTGNAVNALKETENPIIIWKAYSEKNKNYLSITDNGPGAKSENFKALYDDKEVVGIKTGLGLHLIRDLAKAIECEIKVETKLNSGTTIKLVF